jgi:hypothetical protein
MGHGGHFSLTSLIVAPATGTPETGGWSTRELRTILRGLDGINLIAADIVEVAVSWFKRKDITFHSFSYPPVVSFPFLLPLS